MDSSRLWIAPRTAANDNATLIVDTYACGRGVCDTILPPAIDAKLAEFNINRRVVVGPDRYLSDLGPLPPTWTSLAANENEREAMLAALALTADVKRSVRVFIASSAALVASLAPKFAPARVVGLIDQTATAALRPLLRTGAVCSALYGLLDDVVLPLPPRIIANDVG